MARRCWLLEAKPILWVCCCTFAWEKKKKLEQLLHSFSQQMGCSIGGTFTRLESNYVAWPSLDLHFY